MAESLTMSDIDVQEPQKLQTTIVSLGEGNIGKIGPENQDSTSFERIKSDIGETATASQTWICVDGRVNLDGSFEDYDGKFPAQIAGGIVISDTAADIMSGFDGNKLSELVKNNTIKSLNQGFDVTVHGDQHAGKFGCGANKLLRGVLESNARNTAVVAPIAWSLSQALGIDEHLSSNDVSRYIENGKQAADDYDLWDINPDEVVDLVVENGGKYEVVVGEHTEQIVRLDLTSDGTFNKAKFLDEHSGLGAFGASLGAYSKAIFERYGIGNERAASLHVLGAVLFNVGVCKQLGNEKLEAVLVH